MFTNLDDIGFYTLSDKRARKVSWTSDLQRCELILTDRCNFKCEYCRGIKKELQGDLSLDEAKHVVDLWASANLKNIRFSGGEPTIWPGLLDLVKYSKEKGIQRIALSTNGSATEDFYNLLFEDGVNDFSISLDACCASTADAMAGTNARFEHISQIIRFLSKKTYCTVGVVLDERNVGELVRIVEYATSLGVSDIRIIPSAQWDRKLDLNIDTTYPILKYRLNNIKIGKHVRGLQLGDCAKCHLVKDDMAILHGQHFPCIIYMREQGAPIGSIEGKTIEQIRMDRKAWFNGHDTLADPICSKNCLDVCIDHNNMVEHYRW